MGEVWWGEGGGKGYPQFRFSETNPQAWPAPFELCHGRLSAQAHFSCWLQDFVVPAWLSGSKPIGAAPSPPLTAHKEGQPSPSRLIRAGSIKQVDSSRKLAEPALATKDTIMRSGRLDTLYCKAFNKHFAPV